MTQQFADHEIDAQFFNAIEPRNSTDELSSEELASRMRRYGRGLSRGETFVEETPLDSVIGSRPGITSLSMRVSEHI